jgi:D-alanine--D-alanine ligase
LIVKPNSQGSTVGLTFVKEMSCLCPALADAFSYDTSILIEEWITGTEISVPVLNGEALPPVEIAPDSGFYDFASKYLPGATLEIIPARLPENVLTEAQGIALACHRTLGCEGATRTDMIVRNPESDRPEIFVLEVNTLPGMTATSLLPNSAAAAGIPFDELCVRLIEDALARATS